MRPRASSAWFLSCSSSSCFSVEYSMHIGNRLLVAPDIERMAGIAILGHSQTYQGPAHPPQHVTVPIEIAASSAPRSEYQACHARYLVNPGVVVESNRHRTLPQVARISRPIGKEIGHAQSPI